MIITARQLSTYVTAVLAAASFPFFVACQDDPAVTTGAAGTSTAGTSPVGMAGSATTAAGTGGSGVGTAGSSVGGSAVTAGGAGAAGASMGGQAGTASGGASGNGTGGASGGAGGSGGASGGAGGSGGASGGAGGSGGASGGAGGTGGAACGTITKATDGSYMRTGWTAVYACTGGACPAKNGADTGDVDTNAFDGDFQTRWSTGVYQSALKNQSKFPLTFTVDMKMAAPISKLTTHPGCKDIFDSPGTIEVAVSTNGTDFTTVTTAPHTPVVPANEACPPNDQSKATDTITFPTTCARYVRLTGTQRTTSDRYWAIGEMYIYP
jgi:F5/8 type C domain